MDFNNLPVLQMMTKKMSWLSHRTEIISQNVAHGDTPGFHAKDLKQVSFQELVRKEGNQNGFPPNRTHGTHLVGMQARTPFATEASPDAYETTLDNNDVSIEQGVTMGRWAWGSRFVDLNNDGWEDLVVANGFISTEDTGDL